VIVVAVETTMAGLHRRLRAIWRVAAPPSRMRLAIGLALAVSLPLLFTSQFDPHHLHLPGLVFLTAVCASTVVGGVVPGMVCALVSGVVLGQPVLADAGDLALFVAFGVLSPTLLQHARIMRRAARDQADLAEGQLAFAHQAEKRYQSLVEALPLGIYIDLPDHTASNVYSSPVIESLFGYAVEEWTSDPEFFSKVLHEADRDRVLAQVAAALDRRDATYSSEYRLRHKDGRVVWVRDHAVIVKDEQGNPEYVQGYLADITESRRVAELLGASEERFRSLFEHLPIATYADEIGPAGKTRYVSPHLEEMLGYSSEEWQADNGLFFKVLHPDDREEVAKTRLEGYEETDSSREFRVVSRAGRTYWVQSERVVVRDADGQALYTLGFWFDLTERRRLEHRLRQAERLEAVGQLTGGLAHDFNNLLTVIAGYSNLALESPKVTQDDELRSELQEISRAAGRATLLTQQLLAFSSGQQMTPEVLDLNTTVTDVARMFGRLIGSHITVSVELESEPRRVLADRSQIEQVLANLALNARDAMPSGGELSIATRNVDLTENWPMSADEAVSGSFLMLQVSDTGSGMDEATAAKAFEPFFTTKDIGEGTGLGLATVLGIVRQSGGHVHVESALGAGTCIKVYLPETDREPAKATPRAPLPTPAGNETVLLVEDNIAIRGLVRNSLSRLGYTITNTQTPHEALGLYERGKRFDLIVTDIQMPGMTGTKLAEQIRRLEPEQPILFISGFSATGDTAVGPLLQKPFTMGELGVKVRQTLDRRPQAA
jgi:two-component system cell cycle sensor histidine kinase/response regulator CckA